LATEFGMYVGPGSEKKRDNKIAEKQERMEKESMRSGDSKISVGSKLSNRATVKEVKEEDWKFTGEIDIKSNKYFKCKRCNKEKVRDDNRRTHKCIA
jgi:hypothetical protein